MYLYLYVFWEGIDLGGCLCGYVVSDCIDRGNWDLGNCNVSLLVLFLGGEGLLGEHVRNGCSSTT